MKRIFICILLINNALAVRNGIDTELEDGKFPNIAYVEAIGICTGQRVSFNQIMTVSHCIDKTFSTQRRFKVTYMDGVTKRTERVNFNSVKRLSKNFDKELSIFTIKPESPESSFKATRILPFEGNEDILPDSVVIAGYGVTADKDRKGGTLRYGQIFYNRFKVLEDGDYRIYFQPSPVKREDVKVKPCHSNLESSSAPLGKKFDDLVSIYNQLSETEKNEKQAVCKGDSGGPVYAKTKDGELVLIGLNSTAFYDKKLSLKRASDYKVCGHLSGSAIVPLYSNRAFMEKHGVAIEVYK